MGTRTPDRAVGNVTTAVTSFVGRRHELASARQRMAESRLVTFVGVGGVGKTRLALRVAAEGGKAFRDGVWMVDLASLTDQSRLAQTILSALEVRDQSARRDEDKLAEHLKHRQLLIVLDNCEHLLQPSAVLTDHLLRVAPGLRVLATSRQPLGIDGEHLLTVRPMSAPTIDTDCARPLEALPQYDAVQLLIDRARAVRPDFELTQDNHRSVAQLCAWLDGIPLAIELAAARLRSLSVAEVVERLVDRFGFLTGGSRAAQPRQQTLRSMINWSYELCTHEEQLLWARLSVFAGSFDLVAAERVCSGDDLKVEVIADLVDRLVAKSLLLADRDGERVRYRMLVTVREFGGELLVRAEQEEELRRRHRDHYLGRARTMAAEWCGPDQAVILARMREDHSNLVAALEWSASRPWEARTAATLAAALRYHWVVGGFLSEGRQWLDQLLDDTEPIDEGRAERGAALWVAAWVSLVQGDWAVAEARLAECTRFADELCDEALAAHAAHWSGLAALFRGRLDDSITLFDQAVAGHRAVGDTAAELTLAFQLAAALAYHGQLDRARQTCEETIRVADSYGERWSRAYAQWATGLVNWHEDKLIEAQEVTRTALAVQPEFRDGICAALSTELLACIAAKQRHAAEAARLFGAALAIWGEIGTAMHSFGPVLEAPSVRSAELATTVLGRKQFDELVAQERSRDMAGAIAAVSQPQGTRTAQAHSEPPNSPLSRRETDVARLVAQGMNNRAIATALVISPRTVDGHVERILAKLAFNSRTQVAAWAAEHLGPTHP